jgi:type III secretion system YscI/HrpB-like protein
MGPDKILSSLSVGQSSGVSPAGPKENFGEVFSKTKEAAPSPAEFQPQKVVDSQSSVSAGKVSASGVERIGPLKVAPADRAAFAVDSVSAAQARLEGVLRMAESGRNFTPQELLALQAQVYSASLEIDLTAKVVEKATGGVKQVLQTQV